MSVKLSAYVWDGCASAGIKGTKLLILARLADFSSDEGISWPSVDTIARQIGAGRSTVITAVGELERDGWLTRKERRQGQRSGTNIYTLNVARLRQAAAGAYSQGPVSEHSESERSEAGRPESERPENRNNRASQGPESGHDPSVTSKQEPSDKKTSCQVARQPDAEQLITDKAIAVLKHLNLVTGARYQNSKSSLENIRARLREGHSVDDLQLVVDYKHEHWHDTEMYDYMRPQTLFFPSKLEGYLLSATRWKERGRPPRHQWKQRSVQRDDSAFKASYAGVDYSQVPEGFRS
ncbi:conserved phage C-terminal domain-containing protein [Cronobacter malonaticus]|nr:conserved phage C-terminal domain-containing protein [Cronobacter malonaticus]